MLNDVSIWAGAYIIDLTKKYEEVREKSQNCAVVNGNLNNCYSTKDSALSYVLPNIFYPGMRAVGTYDIFKDIKEAD